MAHFQTYDLEYADGYYNTSEFEDDFFSDDSSHKNSSNEAFDSDFEDDFDTPIKSKTDTTAVEVRNGKDIQGIPWERMNYTRDKYRETRLQQYKNFESLSSSRDDLEKDCKKVENNYTFYNFQFNTRLVKSTIVHFQLRNLMWATSKHDVYLMQNYSVMHWSALKKKSTEVMNTAKPVIPTMKNCGLSQPLSRVQISTLCVKDGFLAAGGFHGELIYKNLNKHGFEFSTKLTMEDNAITNSVDIFQNPSGSRRVVTANNDAQVRIFDSLNFNCVNQFSFDWSVNNTSASPDGKSIAVLGDSTECLVADAHTGKMTNRLKGHLDYSFSSAWHPDGRILATGNQDTTCRLWDIRNTSESFAVLKGRMGAIRALKFSSDGRFLAMAEPADFVHVFDAQSGFNKSQEIDLFGEIGGISFSPDTEALFVGVADRTYGSVLEFSRKRNNSYVDAIY